MSHIEFKDVRKVYQLGANTVTALNGFSLEIEAGEFAVAFSRGWREGVGSADVYWVKPEQLSKSGPSGEFVTGCLHEIILRSS